MHQPATRAAVDCMQQTTVIGAAVAHTRRQLDSRRCAALGGTALLLARIAAAVLMLTTVSFNYPLITPDRLCTLRHALAHAVVHRYAHAPNSGTQYSDEQASCLVRKHAPEERRMWCAYICHMLSVDTPRGVDTSPHDRPLSMQPGWVQGWEQGPRALLVPCPFQHAHSCTQYI
jgi:hypothetical protein